MQVHIISSFHYDYLYLEDSETYFQLGFRILDKAMELLEAEPEWNFTVEQTILIEEYLHRFPEKRSVMRRFAREGRLSFAPGMYVMPDMNMVDAESLFLLAKYGKRFLQENFGTDAKACWIADCWGHHAQLPQILKQCGYDGYFFWRCMRHDLKKTDFRWQGLDGSEITAHWLATGYADINFSSEDAVLHAEELSFAAGTADDIQQRLDKISLYAGDTPRLLCNGGDFRMPQEFGGKVLRTLNRTGNLPPMKFSTPEKFLKELAGAELPQASGEFNGAFQGCYSTNILIKQLLYYNREQLLAKETFAALTGGCGISDEEWKQLLRHYFHDTVCGTICDDALHAAAAELRSLYESKRSSGNCLFNPIMRRRHEIYQEENGKRREVKLSPLESRELSDFPEMPELKASAAGCFENRFYRCTYDEKGRITSLKTNQKRELVDTASPAPFGLPVMQMDHGDNWLLYDAPLNGGCDAAAFTDNHSDPLFRETLRNGLVNNSPFFANIDHAEISNSSRECVIIQHGHLQFWQLRVDFKLTVSMDDISPLLKFKLDITPTGKYYRLRAAFPTALQTGNIHHGIPGGIQLRDNCEYPADGFIHYGDTQSGLFLLNRGIPGNNVDENGVMLLSLFRAVAMEYKCASEGSFNRNVPHSFEYAILPHDGGLYDSGNAEAIENYLRPLQRTEQNCKSNWQELPANVRLLALRKHPQGIFLRLAEVWGQPAENVLPFPCLPSDGLENIQYSGNVTPDFRPFEIKNYIWSSNGVSPVKN